ncbi:class I SAM-dependent methyltransferase [Terrihabitans sp. B22-R8]|uniref:class I SAM-dependent methyltransferase n=1 Tax=Terrihabitans sp. B22-R8 TaxID=3425128 RepID=UPI00403C2355
MAARNRDDENVAPRVLNVGSGPYSPKKLHPAFARAGWQEIRMDVDPGASPDLIGDITNSQDLVEAGSFDAVWCSHVLEHLHTHELPGALQEILRILKPDGFLLMNSPDLETVAELVLEHGLDHVAYRSPAGPISLLDIIYGHSASIARGKPYMAHNSGFTAERAGDQLIQAGFETAFVRRGEYIDIWAVGLKSAAARDRILPMLAAGGLELEEA